MNLIIVNGLWTAGQPAPPALQTYPNWQGPLPQMNNQIIAPSGNHVTVQQRSFFFTAAGLDVVISV